MLDTTPVTTAITRLITAGVVDRDLVAAVARRFKAIGITIPPS